MLRDFAPVILAGTAPNVLLVNPSLPAKSVKELIELAKAQPGKFTIGSSGTGTSPQMTGELFRRRAGIDLVHVPYKGGPEATTALLGGQIDTCSRSPRPRCRMSRPASCARSPSPAGSAPRCCRRCRRLPNPACPASRR